LICIVQKKFCQPRNVVWQTCKILQGHFSDIDKFLQSSNFEWLWRSHHQRRFEFWGSCIDILGTTWVIGAGAVWPVEVKSWTDVLLRAATGVATTFKWSM
jgi:hypothetical protein